MSLNRRRLMVMGSGMAALSLIPENLANATTTGPSVVTPVSPAAPVPPHPIERYFGGEARFLKLPGPSTKVEIPRPTTVGAFLKEHQPEEYERFLSTYWYELRLNSRYDVPLPFVDQIPLYPEDVLMHIPRIHGSSRPHPHRYEALPTAHFSVEGLFSLEVPFWDGPYLSYGCRRYPLGRLFPVPYRDIPEGTLFEQGYPDGGTYTSKRSAWLSLKGNHLLPGYRFRVILPDSAGTPAML